LKEPALPAGVAAPEHSRAFLQAPRKLREQLKGAVAFGLNVRFV
jgi:hypothetical protein